MAINKEIWVNALVEGFFPNNSFAMRSVDHSAFVNGKTVHVPNGGTAPDVHISTDSGFTIPATAVSVADSDLTYDIAKYYSTPVHMQALDVVELSYDKRNAVIALCKKALQKRVMEDLLKSWVPMTSGVVATDIVATTGGNETAHIHATATGNRKKMVAKDVLAVKKVMDGKDVPAEGRCMLLDSVMYNQLLDSLTDAAVASFLAGADPVKGVVGRYMGFDIYMRSSVLALTATSDSTNNMLVSTAAATDCAAGVAWQTDCVSRALGEVEAFEAEKDPSYYGDVVSFAMRAGGTCLRSDKKGVVVVKQG